jgi:N4-gp56 family major capsid protein
MNKTTTAGLAPGMQEYFDRKLLRTMKPKLVHTLFGQQRPLPANNGTTAHFRRWNPFEAAPTPLEEGVTPEGQELSQSEVTATIQQYGKPTYITDKLAKTHLDRVVNETMGLVADQGALTIDHITRDVLNAGTNVIYANGKTARNALAASDKLTGKEIRMAVKALKKAKAPKDKDGYYICIIGPDGIADLQDDEDWKKVSEYQDKNNIYSGEVKRLWGCKFIETTEAKIFEGAGNGGADVASALVLGADAYGVIRLDGSNVKTIVKPMGYGDDPLDQRCSVSWKVEGYVAKILEQTWMVRIESGVAA